MARSDRDTWSIGNHVGATGSQAELMRAAWYESFGGPVEIVDIPDPSPPPGGVVIRVGATGVCRSDWHGWMGHDEDITLPHVPGHELAGTVVAKNDVLSFEVGDRVTVPFVLGCGRCHECASGNQQICDEQYQPGFSGWGSFAEFVALPYADGNLVALPDDMTFVAAAGLGCRFATAYRAVVVQGEVTQGTRVAVWGCGGVGLSAVMVAASLGATVVAIDISSDALDMATRVGAAHGVIVTEASDGVDEVAELLDGGAEVSIDALGSSETSVSSIRCLAKRGRHIQAGLMVGAAHRTEVPMWRLHADEIQLLGVHGMPAWQYPGMLDMISSGALSPESLVSRVADLEAGVNQLMEMADYPGFGVTIIDRPGTMTP